MSECERERECDAATGSIQIPIWMNANLNAI